MSLLHSIISPLLLSHPFYLSTNTIFSPSFFTCFTLHKFPSPHSYIALLLSFLYLPALYLSIPSSSLSPHPSNGRILFIFSSMCWVFPKLDKKWLLFICRPFNYASVSRTSNSSILSLSLASRFWRWFLNVWEICAGLNKCSWYVKKTDSTKVAEESSLNFRIFVPYCRLNHRTK
jgi:hypothetical protein